MAVGPTPMFPEKGTPMFERSMAASIPGNRGPLRFEEGIATDTDVPYDFSVGAYEDTAPAPGRENHTNPEMFFKYPEETMRERAHVGTIPNARIVRFIKTLCAVHQCGRSQPRACAGVYGGHAHSLHKVAAPSCLAPSLHRGLLLPQRLLQPWCAGPRST